MPVTPGKPGAVQGFKNEMPDSLDEARPEGEFEMTKIQAITWQTKDGKEIKANITVIRAMESEVAYADGWNVELPKKPVESLEIEIYVAGKFFGRTYSKPSIVATPIYSQDFVNKVKAAGGYAILTDKIMIKEDKYNEIVTLIDAMIAEASQDPEYAEYKGIKVVKEAEQAKALETMRQAEVPAEAIDAYNQYAGSSEKAWEAEDERAWALIERWGKYIEVQQGVHPDKVRELLQESNREANFGIND